MNPINDKARADGETGRGPNSNQSQESHSTANRPPMADQAKIIRAVNILHGGGIVELRAIFSKGKKRTDAGYFDGQHRQALADHAAKLNKQGAAVYITLNGLDEQLLSRYCNRVQDYAPSTATDANVTRRQWLLIDLDPVRPKDTSATDTQLDAAKAKAGAVYQHLKQSGWPEPVTALSGNGYHLLYSLDLPNDEPMRDLIKGVLAALAALFDDDTVKIDQTVSNAGRITKLYGTVANKGDHTPTAPHRLSSLITVPENIETVSPEQLKALQPAKAEPRQPQRDRPKNGAPFDLEGFLARGGITYTLDNHQGRERYKLDVCPFNPDHGKGEAAVFRYPDGKLGFKCQHDSCAGKTWADVRDLVDGPRGQRPGQEKTPKRGPLPDVATDDSSWPKAEWRPESITDAGDTDLGNTARLFDRNGRDMLFVREVGWHRWTGARWAPDEAGAKRLADDLPRIVLTESAEMSARAAAENDPSHRQALHQTAGVLLAWAKKCEKAIAIEAALGMLERRLIIEPTEADADPFLLATANGTLDLRTGTPRPSMRGDFITMGSAIAFDPSATCPTFDKFLQRIFRTHQEVIPFLQRAIGYTLTGDTREQCLFILHGSGCNGKSTLVNVLEWLLGDYANQAPPDLLVAKTGDRHPTEIADLRGARLVATVETGEGKRLAESLVKQMSGGDRLKGRYMRRDFFEFTPTFKLWMATNHRPAIRGTDLGIWRRIRLIPFAEVITDEEKDPMLPGRLKGELPGILAWAVRGCLEWQRDGLRPPDAITTATLAYKQEQDQLAAFFEECCIINPRCEVKSADLYKAYSEWCDRTGEYAEKQRKFGESLTERGFQRFTSNGVRYRGLGLLVGFTEGTEGTEPKTGITHRNGSLGTNRKLGSEGSEGSVKAETLAKKWDSQNGCWEGEEPEPRPPAKGKWTTKGDSQ